MNSSVSLMAYAYELQPGDVVDGHIVRKVDDPHRPATGPAWSDGKGGDLHGDCTIRFDGGAPITCDRLTEFTLLRPGRAA